MSKCVWLYTYLLARYVKSSPVLCEVFARYDCASRRMIAGCKSPGSPPRLWGIQKVNRLGKGELRFTPTPVGNTIVKKSPVQRSSVHPHACGEYVHRRTIAENQAGSPPRLWGILWACAALCFRPRFTPTPVGNTPCTPLPCVALPVHPHACGEYPILSKDSL